MAATLDHDLVSEEEILGQMAELQVLLPRAGDLRRSARQGRMTTRDALYFLLLDAVDRRRHSDRPLPSRGR